MSRIINGRTFYIRHPLNAMSDALEEFGLLGEVRIACDAGGYDGEWYLHTIANPGHAPGGLVSLTWHISTGYVGSYIWHDINFIPDIDDHVLWHNLAGRFLHHLWRTN